MERSRTNVQNAMGKTARKFYGANVVEHHTSCVVDTNDCMRIYERLDGLKPNPSTYEVDADVYNIYIGVNLWLHLFSDVTHASSDVLKTRIMLYGLQDSILEADEHRCFLISEGANGKSSEFWNQYFPMEIMIRRYYSKDITHAQTTIKNALSVLGCLKRIRLASLDYSFMYTDYLKLNNKCKLWNQRHYVDFGDLTDYSFKSGQEIIPRKNYARDEFEKDHPVVGNALISMLREAIAYIFKDYKRDDTLFALPPGATYEGAHTYLEKFKIVMRNQQWLRENGVNIPFWPIAQKPVSDCNRYITVPKNYTVGRGVAPEPVTRQVLGYQVSSGMRKCLRAHGVDLNDQGRNQFFCSIAYTLGLDTDDLKNASDSISVDLVDQLFVDAPNGLLDDMRKCRTEYISVNGNTVKNFRFCTMGNTITCDVQSGIYLAVALVAESLCGYPDRTLASRADWPYHDMPHDIIVYNDDIIVPHDINEVFMSIMQKLGFTINIDKSFIGSQRYRESCGVEYFRVNGIKEPLDVTPIYYPRGTSRYALPELVGLQHKYYMYQSTNGFLISCILDVYPDITCSEPGSIYTDVWDLRAQPHLYEVTECYDLYHIYSAVLPTVEMPAIPGVRVACVKTFSKKGFYITDEYSTSAAVRRNTSFVNVRKEGITWVPIKTPSFAEEHTTFIAGKVKDVTLSKDDAELVELLGYCLALGHGAEHINQSEYTRLENQIHSKEDLYSARTLYVEARLYT
jgi:hypothetical protein